MEGVSATPVDLLVEGIEPTVQLRLRVSARPTHQTSKRQPQRLKTKVIKRGILHLEGVFGVGRNLS